MSKSRLDFLAAVLALASGCSVRTPDGRLSCAQDSDCPSAWFCHDDDRCYRTPMRDAGWDAAADGGGPDASDDDGGPDGASGSGGEAGRAGAGGAAGSGGAPAQGGRGGDAAGSGGGPTPSNFRVLAATSGTLSDVTAALEVSFSKPLAAPSVNATSFAVTRDGKAISGKLSVNGSDVRFQPDLPWALAGAYTVKLSEEIQADDGEALVASTRDFKVREGTWSRDKRADGLTGGTPLVAMAPDGWAMVVWSVPATDTSQYEALLERTFTPPSTWSDAVPILPSGTTGLTAAVVNARHHAAVTWSSISANVQFNSLTDSTWASTLGLSSTSYNVFMSLQPNDEIYVLCDTLTKGSESTLVGYHFTLGASSPASVDVGGTASSATGGKLALLGDTPRLIWQQTDADGTKIMTGGFESTAGVQLSEAGSKATDAQLATNAKHTAAVAVWKKGDGIVMTARIPAGGNWSTPVQISPGTSGAESPQVAVDDSGRAVALWVQNGSVMSAVSGAIGDWSPSVELNTDAVSGLASPRIALEPGGHGVATWVQDGPSMGLNEVWVARYRADEGWKSSTRARVSDMEAGTNDAPSLAIDHSGRAFAAWYQSNQVWTARFE